jgi:hypothetical protein
MNMYTSTISLYLIQTEQTIINYACIIIIYYFIIQFILYFIN